MSHPERKHDVLIVGGGVVGLFCAYFLQQAGREVTLLERRDVGAGASSGNCGLISPSHIMPLSQPGVLWQGLKWMWQPDAPLHVRPNTVLQELGWFGRFTHVALGGAGGPHAAARKRQTLLNRSRALYTGLADSLLADADWQTEGSLFIFRNAAKLEASAKNLDTERTYGVRHELLDGATLVQREPTLQDGLAGAVFYPDDAHLRPERLLAALRAAVTAAGGRILTGEAGRVTALGHEHRPPSVATGDGALHRCDHLVIATGALTSSLLARTGHGKRILPGKGYSITMPRPEVCPTIPCLFQETKCVVTPWSDGYRIGSTMEFAGFDDTLNPRRLQALREGIRPYLRPPYPSDGGQEWCGWRPMTHDGVPMIGPLPSASRVFVAAGHNMLGVSMSPATGELIAALITESEPAIDPALYALH